jgi:hypothetical protein
MHAASPPGLTGGPSFFARLFLQRGPILPSHKRVHARLPTRYARQRRSTTRVKDSGLSLRAAVIGAISGASPPAPFV